MDQSDVDSDDNGDIFMEKKLRLSCQNLHETKVTCHLLETRSGDEGSAGSRCAGG